LRNKRKTSDSLIKLISYLKKKAYENEAPIWKDIAKRLQKPSKNWAEVNLRRLAEHTKKGETVVIPGKCLGSGELIAPITVAAYSFSESAKKKIKDSGGTSITIPQLIKMNPKGKDVRIIG